ncbi:MAG: hypothetical protein QF464_22535, partial [Myxococcota bacterium]|nr:hypothetical protein [Myxococcota bacterium]
DEAPQAHFTKTGSRPMEGATPLVADPKDTSGRTWMAHVVLKGKRTKKQTMRWTLRFSPDGTLTGGWRETGDGPRRFGQLRGRIRAGTRPTPLAPTSPGEAPGASPAAVYLKAVCAFNHKDADGYLAAFGESVCLESKRHTRGQIRASLAPRLRALRRVTVSEVDVVTQTPREAVLWHRGTEQLADGKRGYFNRLVIMAPRAGRWGVEAVVSGTKSPCAPGLAKRLPEPFMRRFLYEAYLQSALPPNCLRYDWEAQETTTGGDWDLQCEPDDLLSSGWVQIGAGENEEHGGCHHGYYDSYRRDHLIVEFFFYGGVCEGAEDGGYGIENIDLQCVGERCDAWLTH